MKLSWSTHFILNEGSLIYVLICPSVFAFALHHALMHFALIYITIFEVIFAHSMLFAIAGFSLVDSIFIFERFFGELKSISNSFLAEHFLWDILQLPKNYFEGSISHLFGWDVRELTLFGQNV